MMSLNAAPQLHLMCAERTKRICECLTITLYFGPVHTPVQSPAVTQHHTELGNLCGFIVYDHEHTHTLYAISLFECELMSSVWVSE